MLNYGDHMSKTRQLREMLLSDELAFIMEAHDGISSKIVEEAGFKGIWASGLSMSAALGVRDSNEASWTQVLDVLEFMSDATTIPILVDGDTGYGNFNNMRRAVQKLCQRNIAGICIEDKLFPKTNSFIGDGQPLADIDEFCGKIKAGKDSQLDDDFSVFARGEALISGGGWGGGVGRGGAGGVAGGGSDLRLGHGRGIEAGWRVSRSRGGWHPDSFQNAGRGGNPRVPPRMGPALPGGDRTDYLLSDADGSVPGSGHVFGDLGQSQYPRWHFRHA